MVVFAALFAILSCSDLWFLRCLLPQLDTEYRKKWDALVIKLEVVDRDPSTGSEIVHWATHFPVSFYTPIVKVEFV